MAALEDEYDLIAYDYRDHGETEASPRREYSMGLFVDDLHALLDELAVQRPVFCAHSYGGLIAAEYAIQYPDDVAGLAFVDARTDLGENAFERGLFRLQPILDRVGALIGQERFDRVMEFVAARFADMEQGPDEEVPELGLKPSEYADEASSELSTGSKFTAAGMDYVGTTPTDFHVPVLYAYGELSGGVIADKAEQLERAPTDVRVHEVGNAGHGVMLEQPDQFTDVLSDFLDDVTPGTTEVNGGSPD
jgi:pimeloyl-ACP methyl ester carboxylesterase